MRAAGLENAAFERAGTGLEAEMAAGGAAPRLSDGQPGAGAEASIVTSVHQLYAQLLDNPGTIPYEYTCTVHAHA